MCEGCADTCKHVLMKARTISGEKKLIEIAWPTQAMADLSVLPSVNNIRVFFFSNYELLSYARTTNSRHDMHSTYELVSSKLTVGHWVGALPTQQAHPAQQPHHQLPLANFRRHSTT